MNIMGLLEKFLVQSNIGEPSWKIYPEIAFGRSCERLKAEGWPNWKELLKGD